MDFDQPEVETVQFQVKLICFEPIVIFVFLDFVLYEYSSFSSSRNSFYTLESGRTVHKNQLISVLFWGPKTQLKLGLNSLKQNFHSEAIEKTGEQTEQIIEEKSRGVLIQQIIEEKPRGVLIQQKL